jgi:signal transduction histidine kinase
VNDFPEAAGEQAGPGAAQAAVRRDHAAQICHDLRGPLAVLYPALAALRVPELADGQRLLLDAAERSVVRLAQMVESLGGSGWLEVDRPPAVAASVDLRLVLEALLHQRAVSGAAGFVVALPPGLPPLKVDEAHLRLVLGALLANAARFAADGGTITVSAEARGADVLVSVRDDGGGIAADEIAVVCAFGYRGANNPPGWAGLGLGLYAGKTLVEGWGGGLTVASGGGLTVASGGGRGTTVLFSAPAAA